MRIIINSSSMVPIYEQITDQIKTLIRGGELKENDNLPSVRALSKDLRISALTVKKAYDSLEEEGFAVTVHGKGTYVVRTMDISFADGCFTVALEVGQKTEEISGERTLMVRCLNPYGGTPEEGETTP